MYEWDDLKDEANREKHGVGFELALQFDWPIAVVEQDERFEYGEVRYRAFGRIAGKGFCLAFTFRASNIRVISIRPMHEKETCRYGI
jgi:uncharacterized DUF497 family protein